MTQITQWCVFNVLYKRVRLIWYLWAVVQRKWMAFKWHASQLPPKKKKQQRSNLWQRSWARFNTTVLVLDTLISIHHSVNFFSTGTCPGLLIISNKTITKLSANLIMWLLEKWLWHIYIGMNKIATVTRWNVSVKTYISQQSRLGSMLKVLFEIPAKIWGWMQLKAEEKSIKSSCTLFAPSRCVWIKLRRVHLAPSTALYGL